MSATNPATPPGTPAAAPAAPAGAAPAAVPGAVPVAPAAPQTLGVVLYVDDEEQALKYFKKAFGKSFEVLTAPNVDEAIALLQREHARVNVLATDHRMPGKTGVELLAHVKQNWPHIVRILMTAYADKDSAIESVNSGAVFKYLTKPIDLAQTKQVLIDAMGVAKSAQARDAALSDRGSMIERMIVADRVRTTAAVASGVSHHMRNSLTAMSCFFEVLGEKVAAAKKAAESAGSAGSAGSENDAYLGELLELANKERDRLVGMIQQVESRGGRPKFTFASKIDVAELVAAACAASGVTPIAAEVPNGLATLAVDAEAVGRMLRTLIVNAQRYSPSGATVRVTVEGPVSYWNSTAVRIRVLGHGTWEQSDVEAFFTPFAITTKHPDDIGLELLDAFRTATGHEGDLVAHARGPNGPGFEIHLPLDPAAVKRATLVDGELKLAV
jgi:CheY-like chemotaxis protein